MIVHAVCKPKNDNISLFPTETFHLNQTDSFLNCIPDLVGWFALQRKHKTGTHPHILVAWTKTKLAEDEGVAITTSRYSPLFTTANGCVVCTHEWWGEGDGFWFTGILYCCHVITKRLSSKIALAFNMLAKSTPVSVAGEIEETGLWAGWGTHAATSHQGHKKPTTTSTIYAFSIC